MEFDETVISENDPFLIGLRECGDDETKRFDFIHRAFSNVSVALLIHGKMDAYHDMIDFYNNQKIIDPRPGGKRDILKDYMTVHFRNGSFKSQRFLTEYLINSFEMRMFEGTLEGYQTEFHTKYGKCDFLLDSYPYPEFLELKIGKIAWADIYQVFEYKRFDNGQYPGVILGYKGIEKRALDRAKEYDIGIYLYTIDSFAPCKLKIEYLSGPHCRTLDELIPHYQFFGEWEQIARSFGWPLEMDGLK